MGLFEMGNNKINYKQIKNKKDSNGMIKSNNLLIPGYVIYSRLNYINVSINDNRARMAEWLTQLIDTGCPSGFVGSIPTPGAENLNLLNY